MDMKVWEEARKSCKEYEGDLAIVQSFSKRVTLLSFMKKNISSDVWIGLHGRAEYVGFYILPSWS